MALFPYYGYFFLLLLIRVDGVEICECIVESLNSESLPQLTEPKKLGYSKLNDGTWIPQGRPNSIRHSPDSPIDNSQSIPFDRRIPSRQVFPEFIGKLKGSSNPSARKLAEELEQNHNPGEPNDLKWPTTWDNIRDKFNKNVDPNSIEYQEGIQIINQAIYIGQHPYEDIGDTVTMPPTFSFQLPNEAHVIVPPIRGSREINVSRVLDYETIRLPSPERPLDTTEMLDFTKSEEYPKMLQDYIFCLDFSRGIVRLETREHVGLYIFNNATIRVSEMFIDFLRESDNAAVRNLTEKYVEQLQCVDSVTHKNWLNIWTDIKKDFARRVDQNMVLADEKDLVELIVDKVEGMAIINMALQIAEMFQNLAFKNKEKSTTRMDFFSTVKPLTMEKKSTDFFSTTKSLSMEQKSTTSDQAVQGSSLPLQTVSTKNSYALFAILLLPILFIFLMIALIIKKNNINMNFIIDFNRLTIIRRLGGGNFSHVHLVRYRPDKTTPDFSMLAAAKLLVPELLGRCGETEPTTLIEPLDCFVDEIIIRKLNHKNIVKIYGMCINFDISPSVPSGANPSILLEKCSTIAMIYEYMDLGDLEGYLQKKCNSSKHPDMARQYLRTACSILIGITDAFLYLKRLKVVHRDLACRNVLVQSDRLVPNGVIAKVGDFGKAKIVTQKQVIGNKIFWGFIGDGKESLDTSITAPEAMEKHLFTTSSDMYAFGHLIGECIHLMKASTGQSEAAVGNLMEQRRQDGRYSYAAVHSPDRTSVDQINEERPINLADANSNTIYRPIQPVTTMFEAQQSLDPSFQNMNGVTTSLSSSTTCDTATQLAPDVQKMIDQLYKLACSCLKNKIHERTTFKELRIKLRALMNSSKDTQRIESIILHV